MTFVLPSLHGGGAERAAVTLLRALPPDAYDLTLYLFSRDGDYLDDVPRHVQTVVGRQGRIGRLLELRRFLADHPADVVVSFLSHFTVYAAARTSGTDTKYVISQQTPLSGFLADADYHWRRPLRRRVFVTAARAVYRRADLIAATSEGVARDLVDHYAVRPEQISVVHNAVDVAEVERRAAEPLEDEFVADTRPTIVTAGRLADAKNWPLFVESLKRLAARFSFRAWVLGQGEREADLRRALAEAGLADRVRLLGFQTNPWKFMARADVFVLTSKYEGFGNVLIEAMACGLPVVATASPGTTEIVDHERTGVLVDPHEPDAVAAALERVLTRRAFRDQLALAARAKALEFDTSQVVQRFSAALDSIIRPVNVRQSSSPS